ncbi:MAG: LamB/YcsF family protein [Tessaracoccus sp.]|uniref:LamB/YcsF family protein n=1 Tax=Tessaracoccus sp. TaxID=1971211 RepID=UPI001EC019B5|nr:5-oxoprolinase subunit PxpA [Tessaracoccus sp.]MBK7821751.1 LamB/YcsF family protein [Tessaracoccus sp.]
MRIDLNADVGESFGRWRLGDDAGMLSLVTSANVACGFHAGDPLTLTETCRLAAINGVAVGAQVSYRDLAGFGRRFVDASPAELAADVVYQMGALDGICRAFGTRVSYVKPHGALYHAVVGHEGQAAAVVDAVRSFDPSIAVLGAPRSALLRRAAEAGLRAVTEGFADRGYLPDGGLVPRSQPGALLTDPLEVARRVVVLATQGVVVAVDGSLVPLDIESVCLHGDTAGAVSLAAAVRTALVEEGVEVAAFAPAGSSRSLAP